MVVVCCDQMKEILPKTAIIITTVSCHLSGTSRVSRYQKKHSPTHHPDYHPIFISFFHLPRFIASSLFNYVLGNLFAQPLSMSSLVYLLVWSPPPHIPYISSPNQCLFAARAHTIATCFAVVSILYHLSKTAINLLLYFIVQIIMILFAIRMLNE